jgi:hypothetical protein
LSKLRLWISSLNSDKFQNFIKTNSYQVIRNSSSTAKPKPSRLTGIIPAVITAAASKGAAQESKEEACGHNKTFHRQQLHHRFYEHSLIGFGSKLRNYGSGIPFGDVQDGSVNLSPENPFIRKFHKHLPYILFLHSLPSDSNNGSEEKMVWQLN